MRHTWTDPRMRTQTYTQHTNSNAGKKQNFHLCCVAHKAKNAAWTITSNIIESGISSKSVPSHPFGSFSTLRSFAGVVFPTEASKWQTTRPEELNQLMI